MTRSGDDRRRSAVHLPEPAEQRRPNQRPFSVFFYEGILPVLPRAYDDTAMVDGEGRVGTSVVFPLQLHIVKGFAIGPRGRPPRPAT